MQYYENGCGQLHLTFEPNTPCMFFYEENNQGKQDILPQLYFFRNMVAEVGEFAKVLNISFEKSGPKITFYLSRKNKKIMHQIQILVHT